MILTKILRKMLSNTENPMTGGVIGIFYEEFFRLDK